ncbi:MAG: hypothetical protein HOI53_01825 [Francisellaceae bacterium]|jgi:NADH:ubiquinone oxidoreductase subunit E|nr:hypothetical protein [Francisellaceae bacterium]
MSQVFSDKLKRKLEKYLERYETRRSSILPILHAIQDDQGWISEEHIEALEKDYGLHRVHVAEVLSFYSYRTSPPKKCELMLCDNISCCIAGASVLSAKIKSIQKRYNEEKDCPLALEPVPCLGKCDGAPVVIINKTRYENVSTENIEDILSKYINLPS